jgi:hypothetical protein
MKLKHLEVKPFREQQFAKQGGICVLCDQAITDQPVLDHDHDTGIIRGVLHRGCNALLGKIENNMARNRVDLGKLAKISQNLITYITADPITEYLHPTYKTPEERAMKKKKGRGRGRGR